MSPTQTSKEEPFSRYASVLRPGLFAGEVHWVTGGGSGSGIGRCVAHELAALGATVILTGRTEEKLQRVAAEIAQDGGRADTAAFDIRDEDAVRSAVQAAVATHGRIHGLVNNAGGQFPSPLMAIGKKGFETVLANNLTGGFLMMRELYLQSTESQIRLHEPIGAKGNRDGVRTKPMPQAAIKPGYKAIRAPWHRHAQPMLSSRR